jgi:hypothetical protein
MNDDDKRLAAWCALFCILGAFVFVLFTILVAPARAAVVVEIDGQPHVVLDPEDQRVLMLAIKGKDAEIATLRSELSRVKKGCPQT